MGICGSEESKPRRPNNNTNPYSNSVNASKKSSKRRLPKPPNYFIQDDFCIISPIEEDYKISQVIGRGANGTVSIAQNQEGKAFAIKEIFKSKLENKKLIRNEAYVNMNVNHKNIAKCYAIYEDQESIFFVLDLIEGGTLLDFIMDSKDGHLTEEDALDLVARLSDGGMRDALSLMDRAISISDNITSETVSSAAGMAGTNSLFEFSDYIAKEEEKIPHIINNFNFVNNSIVFLDLFLG